MHHWHLWRPPVITLIPEKSLYLGVYHFTKIFTLGSVPYSAKFFEDLNFRGLVFWKGSTILGGCDHFSKHFAELNFRGSRRIRENRENYVPRKFGAIRYLYKSWKSVHSKNAGKCWGYRKSSPINRAAPIRHNQMFRASGMFYCYNDIWVWLLLPALRPCVKDYGEYFKRAGEWQRASQRLLIMKSAH